MTTFLILGELSLKCKLNVIFPDI